MTHKARYFIPGSFLPEEETKTLTERSVKEAAEKAPARAFCFVLYEVADAVPDLGPEFKVVAVPQNESGRYYLGGTLHSQADIEALGDDFRILAGNMRSNHWSRVIRCRTGNWQPFEDADEIVTPSS